MLPYPILLTGTHQVGLYSASNGAQSFGAVDYMAVTPEWSVIGSKEKGFDPQETRWMRKKKAKDDSGC